MKCSKEFVYRRTEQSEVSDVLNEQRWLLVVSNGIHWKESAGLEIAIHKSFQSDGEIHQGETDSGMD